MRYAYNTDYVPPAPHLEIRLTTVLDGPKQTLEI